MQTIYDQYTFTHHSFSVILDVTNAPKVMNRFNVVKRQVGLASQHS